MTSEQSAIVKFCCYVASGFSAAVFLHGFVPPTALFLGLVLVAVTLILIGFSKDEPFPYIVVAVAMLIGFILGVM
jgi:sugar phosphate permease